MPQFDQKMPQFDQKMAQFEASARTKEVSIMVGEEPTWSPNLGQKPQHGQEEAQGWAKEDPGWV